MLALRHLYLTTLLFLLTSTIIPTALAQYTISVPSLKVPIGRKFPVSWSAATGDEPQDVDICLNTEEAKEFIRVGSISREGGLLGGSVDVILDDTVLPGTYTLAIRYPGCSFLLAAEFSDFEVVSPSCGVSPRARN